MSFPLCFSCMVYLVMTESGYAGVKLAVWELSSHWQFWPFFSSLFCVLCWISSVAMMANSTKICSGPWAARTCVIMFSLGIYLATGTSRWRWLMVLAWFLHMHVLGSRNSSLMEELTAAGKFEKVERYRIGTRVIFDASFLVLATLLWQMLYWPFKWCINKLMPQEFVFYAPWIPFFDLGDEVDLGVASYYAPKDCLSKSDAPEYYVCSVGHTDASHSEGENDLQLNRETVRDMWRKCQRSNASGFLANLHCFFPHIEGSSVSKEINFSAWRSSDDAEAWSKDHGGLPGVMDQHSGGQLRTHGNMTAKLKPHGPIRHQDRCSICRRLIESDKVGDKAPGRCRSCGAQSFNYPFF
eukprot:TRINITY_DN82047_c0_g1_i1.p1 TRINITY_DN82047_c0_g1~~TRINITY_DN82047_c0_g1_i1.p1  ORF type:complete len:386 (-),score=32.22 TRINITY_DN82047_c0_g1_i1:104-1165(-)